MDEASKIVDGDFPSPLLQSWSYVEPLSTKAKTINKINDDKLIFLES